MKQKCFFIFCFGLFALPVSAGSMSDADYEKWVRNIYLKHYKDPVSNSEWNKKVQSLPKNYQLRFKDTLWDLSGSFFADSLYWSKLWVANPRVENPHLIYQGNFIKFDPKTLASVNTSKHSVNIQSQFPGLTVPENKFSRAALSESEIPSSLPKLLEFYPVDHEIDISQLQNADVHKETIVPFYLNGGSLNEVGEVISKNGYGVSIGVGGEELVVKIDSSVSIGSVFTVFENRGRIGSFFQSLTLSEDEIMIKGKIRILSYIQGTDSLYIASVIESLQQIFPGDSLSEGEPEVYSFSQKGPIGSGRGLIIGTPDKDQIILSVGSIVYLDKGEVGGVRKGEVFYIQEEAEKSDVFERPYQYDRALLGRLKIIHTAKDKSTGIIVESRDQIYVGDIFTDSLDTIKDLDLSTDHEAIEEADTLDQGKDLLIDFEETPGEKRESLEPEGETDFVPDEPGNYEVIEEPEGTEEKPEDEAGEEPGEESEAEAGGDSEAEAGGEEDTKGWEEVEGEGDMEGWEEAEEEDDMEEWEEAEEDDDMEEWDEAGKETESEEMEML